MRAGVMKGLRVSVVALALCACTEGGAPSGDSDTDDGMPTTPTLSPPPSASQGAVVGVSAVAELAAALGTLTSDQTIELAAGTYAIPGDAFVLPQQVRNVAITGATGDRDDVVIAGGGMAGGARFGFWADRVNGLTFQHLTIRDVREHGIILNCGVEAPVLRNVRIVDAGDQLLKVNPGPDGCGVDNGIVEDSLFEYSTVPPDDYTNGVDVHHGQGWTIRRSVFRNFYRPDSLVGPAILMWNGSRDTVVEDNTFVDNARDIALGLDPTRTAQPPVSNASLTDHTGGRITGNTIERRPGLSVADVPILVVDSPATRVDGNTVRMSGTYPNAIEIRFPRTTDVVVTGNVVDGAIRLRDGASGTISGNTQQ